MEKVKNYLPWAVRILLSGFFFLSAAAKLYPSPVLAITSFEMKQLLPLGFDECFAPFFSRYVIAAEIALGIGLLQPHFLKSIVIPAATLMLGVFSIHLAIEIMNTGGNSGNCGCFGELIPMTPLQSIFKNIASIGLLIYLFFQVKDKEKGQNNPWILSSIFAFSSLFMFGLTPMESCKKDSFDSTQVVIVEDDMPEDILVNQTKKDTVIQGKDNVKKLYEPAPVVSQFSAAIPEIDSNLKLLCFFSPTCDHCQGAGKDIVSVLAKSNVQPKVHIAFQEEPEEVPNFFKIIGREFNHQVFEIRQFMKVFGLTNDVPGVVLMWNGNIIKFYQGSGDAAFSKDKLIKDLKDIEKKLKQ
ncbi:MAG: MauE/DoxX family redox-associated membrane protein [Crocinitomicaceae bacterium]